MDDQKTAEAIEQERDETRKALHKEAIEVGVKIDKRWSNERLLEEISRKHIELAQQKAVTNAQAELKTAAHTETVSARILPMGNNKISKGIHIPGKGDIKYQTGDTMNCERALAEGLQARGFVEIQNAAT